MAESPIAPAHCDVVCAPESPQEDAPTTIPSAGATLGTQTAARPNVSVGATSTAQWLESPIASGPGLLPTATTTSMVAPPESPPMGLPAHRYAATTQLPIVPASDGGWEWGSPDDRRSLNQGTDRWQRLGPIPAVKRQEWARMVLLCWGNRATERAKDQPVDFVREVVEDKMRDQSMMQTCYFDYSATIRRAEDACMNFSKSEWPFCLWWSPPAEIWWSSSWGCGPHFGLGDFGLRAWFVRSGVANTPQPPG